MQSRLTAVINNPPLRAALSTGFLVIAAVILLAVFVFTWIAAANPSAAGCHNAPLRITRDPQWVGIFVCIAGFVVGRLTARPKITSRHQLRSPVEGPEHKIEARARFAVLIQASLTGALFFIAFLLSFEAVTLNGGVWPITYYLRCANEAATWQTLAAAFAFCLLAGRWLWLPTTPEDVD